MPTFTTDWFTRRIPEIKASLEGVPNDANVLEIGSWEGLSTLWFLQRFSDGNMTCVDTWAGGSEHSSFDMHSIEEHFQSNVAEHASRIRVLKGNSRDVLFGLTPRKFDVVYVDGSHDRADALSDIVMSWNLLKVGGVMLVDDCGSDDPGPRLAVQSFASMHVGHWDLLHQGYQIHLRKLK